MRRAFALLLAVFAFAACLVLPAAPASAHAELVSSDPKGGTVLPTEPDKVTLTFSEPVNISLGRIVVLDPDGAKVQDGKPTRRGSGAEIVQKLKGGLKRGTYVASFRVVSADGHPISGAIVFSIGSPSARRASAEATGGAEIDPVVRSLYSLSKYAGYIGLSLLVGGVLILLALWPRRLPSGGPRALLWAGWGVLFAGTLVSIIAQVPYGTGGPVTDITGEALVVTATTGVGAVQVLRLALLLAAIPLLRRVVTGRADSTVDTVAIWLLFGLTLLTWPLSGHAAASPGKFLSIPADAVHVGAMSVWLGGLVMLVRFLLPSARVGEIALILPVWSRWALYAIVTLAVTGTAQAMIEVGTVGALTGTGYGRLVLAKVAGLALIVAIASFSRRWVLSTLPNAEDEDVEPPGARAFRRAIALEIAVGAVLLALAAALVQAVPGRAEGDVPAAEQEAAPTGTAVSTIIKSDKLSVQVQIDPAGVGNNSVHLYAFTPSGAPQQVLEWKGSAAQPGKGVDKLDIPLLPITANHAVGELQLPTAGQWTFSFVVRISDVDQVTVTRDITIR